VRRRRKERSVASVADLFFFPFFFIQMSGSACAPGGFFVVWFPRHFVFSYTYMKELVMYCIGYNEFGSYVGLINPMTGFRETIHYLWSLGARKFVFGTKLELQREMK